MCVCLVVCLVGWLVVVVFGLLFVVVVFCLFSGVFFVFKKNKIGLFVKTPNYLLFISFFVVVCFVLFMFLICGHSAPTMNIEGEGI